MSSIQCLFTDATGSQKLPPLVRLLLLSSLLCLSGGIVNASIDSGLVAHYPFDGNANDATGNGYDGTIIGGVTPTEDRFGALSRAYSFDGSTGYIDLGTAFDIPEWDNYTVSVWVLGYDVPPGGKIIDKTVWFHDWHITFFGLNETPAYVGAIDLQLYESGQVRLTAFNNYRDQQWHHIAITRNGPSGELWIDGKVMDATSDMKDVFTDGHLVIGYSLSPDINQRSHFAGKIDDVRFYNRTLSDAEIRQLAEATALRSYRDVTMLADMNSNNYPETVALRRLSNGHTQAKVADSENGATINKVPFFGPNHDPIGIATIVLNAGGMPELAALALNELDQRIVVEIKNPKTELLINRIVFFDKNWEPRNMTVGDVDNNGVPDVGVLATRKSDGNNVVEYRDAVTGDKIKRIWLGK